MCGKLRQCGRSHRHSQPAARHQQTSALLPHTLSSGDTFVLLSIPILKANSYFVEEIIVGNYLQGVEKSKPFT